jgi:hypothetical protein
MKRSAGIVTLSALLLAAGLLTASDVQAGSALVPPTKTTGASLSATIVIDVTQPSDAGTGATSIRVQKASQSTAAIFSSSYVQSSLWTVGCTKPDISDLQQSTAFRFTGLIDTFVGDETVLSALFSKFGTPHKAAIVDQDYVVCNTVGSRRVLSFTAVIQFDAGP